MENTNGEVILAYNPETLDASKEYPWFNSLMGVYGKEDKVNGTSAADSMPQQTIKFRLPDGYKGYVRVFYEVDDWGEIIIKNRTNDTQVSLIDMAYKKELAGPRNGHAAWNKTAYWRLREASDYELIISHANATYPTEPDETGKTYDARYNISYARFEIVLEKWPADELVESIDVVFDTPQTNHRVDVANEKGISSSTRCASGFVYTGTLTVKYSSGDTESIEVQSGGWMDADSPWTKSNVWEAPDAAQADANPELFPDTCIPAGSYRMGTSESGKYGGFYFDNDDFSNFPDELMHRKFMKLHQKERYGSSGCITLAGSIDWDRLREAVDRTGKAKEQQGLSDTSIRVNVSYGPACSVDYARGLVPKKK